jgi:hypothetical protein
VGTDRAASRYGVNWTAEDDTHLTGWFPRTERWANGEFFRFALNELSLVTA